MTTILRAVLAFLTAFMLTAFCTLLLTDPAAASQLSSVSSASVVPAPQSALEPASSPGVALNWAGYVAQGSTYTSVTGTWVVPSVTTNGNEADATWVGIGGVLSSDLIQAGTEAVPNNAGGIQYQAWYELLPASSEVVPLAVSPGDSITVSITEEGQNSWLISMRDDTTGRSYSTTQTYRSALSSAEWIEEMPVAQGERVGLDDFGTVDFSNGYAIENGSVVTIAQSGAQPLGMDNSEGQPIAVPSVLGADGESFAVTRTDASSSGLSSGGRTLMFRSGGGFPSRGSSYEPSEGVSEQSFSRSGRSTRFMMRGGEDYRIISISL